MKTAYCLIRHEPHYRHDAFVAGLRACGFEVTDNRHPEAIGHEDVLVIWNRYGSNHQLAQRFERAGATVLVAENGYLGADAQGRQFYALAAGHHNGAGRWPAMEAPRWPALGLEFTPWQENENGHILICGQRGIGEPGLASPHGWHDAMAAKLQKLTDRKIIIRRHPGERGAPEQPPLDEQLHGAYAVVVWSSSVAGKALLAGIPAFYDAPHHVLEGAMRKAEEINTPWRGERQPHFERMANAQWSVAEIESGKPFSHLCG